MRFSLKLIRYFANLKVAIVLLILITSTSIVGSLIDQHKFSEFSPNIAEFDIFNSNVIRLVGLDHIFNTVWFICLLVLFGLSLGCCTFFQQLPMLKNIKRIKLNLTEAKNRLLPVNLFVKSVPIGKYVFALQKSNYKVFQCKENIYAIKGLIGRVSPIVVHFSMICVLFGSVYAVFLSFVAQETIPETELFHVQNLLGNNLNTFVPKVTVRVNDFWVAYKVDLSEKQFYTDLSIIDTAGKELTRETIYVNHPLKYSGFTIYQTDWNSLGTRIRIDKQRIYQFPVLNKTKHIWLSEVDNTFLKPKNEAPFNVHTIVTITNWGINYIFNKPGSTVYKFELNEFLPNDLTFLGFIKATGLQVKLDPGIYLIYLGFMLLITSIIASYISCSQIWSSSFIGKLAIYGTSNRSKPEFEWELVDLILKV